MIFTVECELEKGSFLRQVGLERARERGAGRSGAAGE
jgi:hypothetical protein